MPRQLKFIVLIILFIWGCHSSPKKDEKVIVVIGNGKLTLEELVNTIPPSLLSKISKEQLDNYIQQWIEMELIYREALHKGLDKQKDLVKELEDAKREILVRNYLESYLAKTEKVTEEEAREYYNENRSSYLLHSDEVRALHILTASSREAQKAYDRIRKGEDFETVAREVSIDYAQNKRIDLGYFSRQELLPEIASQVFRTRTGRVTRPLKSSFGYHIFKIVSRRKKGEYIDFEEVKDQIEARLMTIKRNERYRDLILGLRNKTDYKLNVEPLNEFLKDSTYHFVKPDDMQAN